MVSTHGHLVQKLGGRDSYKLNKIKCVVIDEADDFFKDQRNSEMITKIARCKDLTTANPQWVLFSATFEDGVNHTQLIQKHIPQILEASQIKMSSEKIMNKLTHIKQFAMKCPNRGKLDFIKEVFEVCEKTQTFIFVNTKDFAETVNRLLKKGGYASYILFSKMSKEERDEIMQKFRDEKINVLVTTDILSRGIDIPEAQLVINFDVPTMRDSRN